MSERMPRDIKYEHWRKRVFSVTWLAYFGFYLTRYSFSASKSSMDIEAMDETTMGLIDSAYLMAYGIGQFVWGALADKVGAKRVLVFGLFCSVIACVAFGASTFVTLFLVLNIIQGLSQSCGWAPIAKNLSCWYSRRERGRIVGWWCTCYAVGSVACFPLAGLGIAIYGGWQGAFYLPAATLLFICLIVLFFHKDTPEEVGLPSIEQYHGVAEIDGGARKTEDGEEEKVRWIDIIRQPMIGLLAASYFLLKPARYAILLWGPYYVSMKLQSGAMFSASITTSFAWAGIIGAVAAGTISDKVFKSKRIPFCVISLAALTILLFRFDGLVSATVKQENIKQIDAISTSVIALASAYPDAQSLQLANSQLMLIAERTTLGDQETIDDLRRVVSNFNTVWLARLEDNIELRTTTVAVRKIARSEQLSLSSSASLYKAKINQAKKELDFLELAKDDPIATNIKQLLDAKRIETTKSIGRLGKLLDLLPTLKQTHPEKAASIDNILVDLAQIKSEMSEYLEDRGDDISFVYQEKLDDILERMETDDEYAGLIPMISSLRNSKSLIKGDSNEQIAALKTEATLVEGPLAEALVTLLDKIQFEASYRKLAPPEAFTKSHTVMIVCLFLIGFFLYSADSQISGVAAIDFGGHKGASSASGFINGCGSMSAIFGGVGVGYIAQYYSWAILFQIFSIMTLIGAIILIPKWNVVPGQLLEEDKS